MFVENAENVYCAQTYVDSGCWTRDGEWGDLLFWVSDGRWEMGEIAEV